MDGVSLSITFSPEDVEVLETILDRYGRDLDQTGIISHILSEIEYATTTDESNHEEKHEQDCPAVDGFGCKCEGEVK